jgi:cytochrome c
MQPLVREINMKRSRRLPTSLLLGLIAVGANAQTVPLTQQLAKNNCAACHAVDRKIVGPSLRDIAKKYRGDQTGAAKLAGKIKSGGVGTWGTIPMPPQSAKDEDIRDIVKQILELG